MKVVFVVATSYSPQKVRLEDRRERQRTSNCPVRIPAELRSWNWSWNWSKPHFLHRRATRNWRSVYRGWYQTRLILKRRYSRNHWNGRDNRLQSVPETESDLSSFWRTKTFSDCRSTQ